LEDEEKECKNENKEKCADKKFLSEEFILQCGGPEKMCRGGDVQMCGLKMCRL
jgi:hypothetical protein